MPLEGAIPVRIDPDPSLSNVNMRPMPGHPEYFDAAPTLDDGELTSATSLDMGIDPTTHPEVEKTAAIRSLSRPTDVSAEVLEGGMVKLGATVVPDEDTKKLVFHMDGHQVGVVDTTGGRIEFDLPVDEGDHEVRAFAFTGEKSGPWSESVSFHV